jgi:hypothetical protein
MKIIAMKTFTLIILSFFVAISIQASENRHLKLMMNVNSQWTKQPERYAAVANLKIEEHTSFKDLISIHLTLVEKTLRKRDVSSLNEKQHVNRFLLLDKLKVYAAAKTFPTNDYLPYKNPVFIDKKDVHCAVGYLIQQSGSESLARKIDEKQKFAYVHEIEVAGVKEWADEFGFTIDELAWIQPGYPPNTATTPLNKGLNGSVNAIAIEQTNAFVYVAGKFSQTNDSVSCSNIACWLPGFAGWAWISVGNGINGEVHALLLHNNKLYAGGEFTQAGSTSAQNVAVYDIALGQWQAMGNLNSSVKSLAVYKNEIYAAGKFSGFLSKWNGTQWVDIAQGFLYGTETRTLEVFDDKLVIGGDFELATGALRRNVVTYDGTNMGISGMGTLTPVNDFEIHEGKLYAACDFVSGNDTCPIAVYDNFDWQKVDIATNFMVGFEGKSVNTMVSKGDALICGGEFMAADMMTYGNNLMALRKNVDDSTNYCQPLLVTDSAVNALAFMGSSLFVGGDFIANNFSDTLNHILTIEFVSTGITDGKLNKMFVSTYPNPASDFIAVKKDATAETMAYEISDVNGKIVRKGTCENETTAISLQGIAAGVYFLNVKLNQETEVVRFVKQ